ncbi:MAG: thiamine pyrophosphate-binding protein [Synechococcus sp. ELA057]
MIKASDFVGQYLHRRGVSHVFELVGGMITHLLDSISRQAQIQIICCHHEQAAGFAAEGYGRISGIPGVALATSGPGATNLLTAVGSCFFDSTPAVFITGQVNTHELKGERLVRQLGFQETDIVSMVRPICKSAVQVQRVDELPRLLHEAFELALSGRQGPCLIDLPMNLQAELLAADLCEQYLQLAQQSRLAATAPPVAAPSADPGPFFGRLPTVIAEARRPLLLMGGGCAAVSNRAAARRICRILGIPAVLSLMGVDLLPADDPLRVGFIGSYGNRWANKALGEADLLVVLGSRLDIRQTGADVGSFCEGKQIWQIDLDPAELGVRVQPDQQVCCSIAQAAGWLEPLSGAFGAGHDPWLERLAELRATYPAAREYRAEPGELNPVAVLQRVSERIVEPCQYVTDVGQHQMWAAQALAFGTQDRFLTSGGMGAMGFGLPTAIGAALASPERLTLLITGDGSFQLNIQELETLWRNRLNLKILLFNNRCHGMVRQFQESYFAGNLQSTADGYSAPDFAAVASAYGIPSQRLVSPETLPDALEALLTMAGPSLLEIPLSISSRVYPKLAFGRRFGEMEPEASPIAMEST